MARFARIRAGERVRIDVTRNGQQISRDLVIATDLQRTGSAMNFESVGSGLPGPSP